MPTINRLLISLAIAGLVPTEGLNAARIAHIDMEADGSGRLTESVSGASLDIYGNFVPENIPGAVGKALRFDGYTTYVSGDLGQIGASDIEAMTVSLWIAPETYPIVEVDVATTKKIVVAGTIDNDAKKGWAVSLGNNGNYSFDFYNGGIAGTVAADDKLPCYQWSHVVVVVGNGRVTIYRNGEKVSATRPCVNIDNAPTAFCIGKGAETSKTGVFNINTFNGLIDDIEVCDIALDPAEFAGVSPQNAADLSIPASRYEDEVLRPRFHGMPATAWTNECHGMTYSDGRYHLFFQKNANGPYMTRLHWGHISSENLYDWREEKIALVPEADYDIKGCWSGCVFTDDEITGGKPNIIYTGVDYVKASIAQAEPVDGSLVEWNRKWDYPIISNAPAGLSDDFRDPYFFRNGDDAYIIVGTSKDGIGAATLHKYSPKSGIWSNRGEIFFKGTSTNLDGRFWEMPTMTRMGDKWLFTATPLDTSRGVAALYWTGNVNADGTFSPDNTVPVNIELPGFARDGYGLLSPTIFQHEGKTIALGIVPDKLPSEVNYDMGYAHLYSLPREWSLDANGNLSQKPYAGLTAMRKGEGVAKNGIILDGSEKLDGIGGREVELMGEFVIGSGKCGFTLLDDGASALRVYYDGTTNEVVVDASGLSRHVNDAGVFDGLYRSRLPEQLSVGQTVKLHVYFDHSIVDLFINDTWAASVRVFAKGKMTEDVTAFSDTPVGASINAWNLDAGNGASIDDVASDGAAYDLSAHAGMLEYGNLPVGAEVSVYDVSGRCMFRHKVDDSCGQLYTGLQGFHIVRVASAESSESTTLAF